MNRRVLFVATVYSHLSLFHVSLMRLMKQMGYEVHAAASPEGPGKEMLLKEGVKCFDIPFPRLPARVEIVVAYRRLREVLRQGNYALVHVHMPVAALLTRAATRRMESVRVLYTAHGFHFYRGAPLLNWLLYYTAERVAARWTDGLIVMNGEDFDRARKMGFRPGENLFYIHGAGVDVGAFASRGSERQIRAELDIPQSSFVLTCVAEINANKNHDFLLAAWKEVAAGDSNAHLLIVGHGKDFARLKEKTATDRIPNVHFLGFRTDVRQILLESNALALVSKREGLPKSIMEAMAAAKPVIATDIRGSRDLVEDNKTGLLVPLGNVPDLIHAIERLMDDPQLCAEMGQAGLEKVQAYDQSIVLQEMSAIYGRYLATEDSHQR